MSRGCRGDVARCRESVAKVSRDVADVSRTCRKVSRKCRESVAECRESVGGAEPVGPELVGSFSGSLFKAFTMAATPPSAEVDDSEAAEIFHISEPRWRRSNERRASRSASGGHAEQFSCAQACRRQ